MQPTSTRTSCPYSVKISGPFWDTDVYTSPRMPKGAKRDDPAHHRAHGVGDAGEHVLRGWRLRRAGRCPAPRPRPGCRCSSRSMSAPTGFDTTLVTRETSTSPTPAGLACLDSGLHQRERRWGTGRLATTATSDGHQRADQVEKDHRLHGAGGLGVRECADDQEEHEHGSNGLQGRARRACPEASRPPCPWGRKAPARRRRPSRSGCA